MDRFHRESNGVQAGARLVCSRFDRIAPRSGAGRSRSFEGRDRPPHDGGRHAWHHGVRLLFDDARLGGAETLRRIYAGGMVSGTPDFGGILSDPGIRDALAFIRASWSPEVQAFQAARTEDEGR